MDQRALRGDFPVPGAGARGGGSRRLVRSHQLILNNAAGVYTGVSVVGTMTCPSTRLHSMMSVHYQADNGSAAALTGWTASLQAWTKNEGGIFLPTNSVIPGPSSLSTALPWSYETATAVDQLRVTVTVPNAPGTGVLQPGKLWLTGTWEPLPGVIFDDYELATLFSLCSVGGDGLVCSYSGI